MDFKALTYCQYYELFRLSDMRPNLIGQPNHYVEPFLSPRRYVQTQVDQHVQRSDLVGQWGLVACRKAEIIHNTCNN